MKNLLSTMSFLFKSCSLIKVVYLLIRCCKTGFVFWNANNINRSGVNKQNTHTHTPNTHRKITMERVNMKINDTPPLPFFFKKHLFYQPIFMGRKTWTPSSLFFLKISKTQSMFQLCLSFFQVKKRMKN